MLTKTKLPGPFKQPWHAVSVAAGPVARPAAEGLRQKRFLSDEAPHCHFQNVRRLGAANAFTVITQIVARFAVGRRIAVCSRALGWGREAREARAARTADRRSVAKHSLTS